MKERDITGDHNWRRRPKILSLRQGSWKIKPLFYRSGLVTLKKKYNLASQPHYNLMKGMNKYLPVRSCARNPDHHRCCRCSAVFEPKNRRRIWSPTWSLLEFWNSCSWPHYGDTPPQRPCVSCSGKRRRELRRGHKGRPLRRLRLPRWQQYLIPF